MVGVFSEWLFSTFKILYVNTTQNRFLVIGKLHTWRRWLIVIHHHHIIELQFHFYIWFNCLTFRVHLPDRKTGKKLPTKLRKIFLSGKLENWTESWTAKRRLTEALNSPTTFQNEPRAQNASGERFFVCFVKFRRLFSLIFFSRIMLVTHTI